MADKKQALSNAYVELASSLSRAAKAAEAYAREINVATTPAQLEALVANPPALPFFGTKPFKAGSVEGSDDEEDVEGKKKKIKTKKIKDPNAPKRPASAYIEFQNAVRDQFRQAEPNASYQEILRKISGVWQIMPEDEKKTWNEITAGKTIEYEEAKKLYKPLEGAEAAALLPTVITVGKDGKEYTGKKRGRKANAEKVVEDPALPLDTNADIDIATGSIVPDASSDKKKKSAVKSASKKKEPTPPLAQESDSSESESDDGSDSDESEEAEVAPPPKKSPASKKSKALFEEKHKSKKSKH